MRFGVDFVKHILASSGVAQPSGARDVPPAAADAFVAAAVAAARKALGCVGDGDAMRPALEAAARMRRDAGRYDRGDMEKLLTELGHAIGSLRYGEVVGVDPAGIVWQWDSSAKRPFSSESTVREFGHANFHDHELQRVGLAGPAPGR